MRFRNQLCGLFVVAVCGLNNAQSASPSAADIDTRVNSLLTQMTLEEKINLHRRRR